jgi:hypothetical protein
MTHDCIAKAVTNARTTVPDTLKQQRITWTTDETERVARRYLELRETAESDGAALQEAQQILPEERRRNTLFGLSQAPKILTLLVEWGKAPQPKARGPYKKREPQAPPPPPAPPAPPPLQDLLMAAVEDLEATLKKKAPEKLYREPPTTQEVISGADTELLVKELVQRKPELFTETASTANLIDLVLRRFFATLAYERERMEMSVVEKVLGHLAVDRSRFEQRLFSIESKLTNGVRKEVLPSAPPPEDKNAYMPLIILAGGERADFQRLQHQLIQAQIRLQKLDISKPTQISVPTHDRVIIWQKSIPEDLVGVVRSRCNPAKVVLTTANFSDLAPLVLKEAEKIRQERK